MHPPSFEPRLPGPALDKPHIESALVPETPARAGVKPAFAQLDTIASLNDASAEALTELLQDEEEDDLVDERNDDRPDDHPDDRPDDRPIDLYHSAVPLSDRTESRFDDADGDEIVVDRSACKDACADTPARHASPNVQSVSPVPPVPPVSPVSLVSPASSVSTVSSVSSARPACATPAQSEIRNPQSEIESALLNVPDIPPSSSPSPSDPPPGFPLCLNPKFRFLYPRFEDLKLFMPPPPERFNPFWTESDIFYLCFPGRTDKHHLREAIFSHQEALARRGAQALVDRQYFYPEQQSHEAYTEAVNFYQELARRNPPPDH